MRYIPLLSLPLCLSFSFFLSLSLSLSLSPHTHTFLLPVFIYLFIFLFFFKPTFFSSFSFSLYIYFIYIFSLSQLISIPYRGIFCLSLLTHFSHIHTYPLSFSLFLVLSHIQTQTLSFCVHETLLFFTNSLSFCLFPLVLCIGLFHIYFLVSFLFSFSHMSVCLSVSLNSLLSYTHTQNLSFFLSSLPSHIHTRNLFFSFCLHMPIYSFFFSTIFFFLSLYLSMLFTYTLYIGLNTFCRYTQLNNPTFLFQTIQFCLSH